MTDERTNENPTSAAATSQLVIAALAAFCVYFCMYAFRKPFSAGLFENQQVFGLGLKTTLVLSQLAGYMLAKFMGIKIVSEMPRRRRALAIVLLVSFAELALVGFAFAPMELKVLMLFLNGLPLGLIFGLVLAYLEGRKHTEALSAALCASFIISSGVVKSIGRWLVVDLGVSEFEMPMLTGLMFLPALFIFVWLLQRTPPPDTVDVSLRRPRTTMTADDRSRFFWAYWPGLTLLILVYVALTVVRTIRDDFGVEIWRDMGIDKTPSIFAWSETVVAICVTVLNAMAICFTNNMTALRATIAMMCIAFLVVALAALGQAGSVLSPFVFMVACGVGLYVPYVAFHTTVFERLLAISRHPGNLAFLMYLADAMGYLGYSVVLAFRWQMESTTTVLPFFVITLLVVAACCMLGLGIALVYFHRKLAAEKDVQIEHA